MVRDRRGLALMLIFALAAGALAVYVLREPAPRLKPQATLGGTDMNLRIDESRSVHFLVREGLTAAHINALSGRRPRLLAAFPAGNSGTAAWFRCEQKETSVQIADPPHVLIPEGKGEFIRCGVAFTAAFNCSHLFLDSVVLGSVRHIRGWDVDGVKPPEIHETYTLEGGTELRLRRPSLDGKSAYEMRLTAANGRIVQGPDGKFEFRGPQGADLIIKVQAYSSDPALTPIPYDKILKPEYLARTDPRTLQLLAFLVYNEKFLAGSWTYLTYFGRDTLLTARLMMDALTPDALEAMLGAVINRLNAQGDVAHEEEIGDFASYKNQQEHKAVSRHPRYDYAMIDDDFLLPAVLGEYLRRTDAGRVENFFARVTDDGIPFREAVRRNLLFVLGKTEAFTADPVWHNLVSLRPDRLNGQWRDSREGLGLGRYPYDVNAALVPAALEAATRLATDPHVGLGLYELAARAVRAHSAWETQAPRLFEVHVKSKAAAEAADAYGSALGLHPGNSPLADRVFHAIALDGHGRPVPVENSDEGFRLLFTNPPDETLVQTATLLMDPFPYGLRSPVGMLIANPVFADAGTQALFRQNHYHGTVVWSWQQALMAAGIRRQLQRADLAPATRLELEKAESALWEGIRATQAYRSAELWTWKAVDGRMTYVPFGEGEHDVVESNPDQGWSHAFLALTPPDAAPAGH